MVSRSLLLISLLVAVALATHELWPLAGGFLVFNGVRHTSQSSIFVAFQSPMRSAPSINITRVLNSSGLPAQVATQVVWTNYLGFKLDIFNLDGSENTAPLSISWGATISGPCMDSSECPQSQYCDIYGGCDMCRFCTVLQDTIHDSGCPDKCLLSVLPEPCVVCASETVACGDGCESTTGFQEFSCSVAPGCAVDGGRGSTSAYPPGNLSVAYMKEMKARLALRRVGVLDLHLATPALATNAERITNIARDVLSCINVTCPEPDSCHTSVTCRNGVCPPLPERMDSAPCDDNNIETDDDRCLKGECVGIDLCANVTCAVPAPCTISLGCSRGVCAYSTAENDTVCDDGDDRTYGDRCQLGMCIGVDPCMNVTCPETVCRFAGRCQRPTGLCSVGEPRPPTTTCDDHNNRTINDLCSPQGECRGTDPCVENSVECSPLSQCHEAGECFLGACSNPQRAQGSACDDGDDRTTNDSCSRGRCRGVDLCLANGVLCLPADQCHDIGDCYQGNCTNPTLPDRTPCDDNNPNTDNDMCFQGVCMGADLCLGVACDPLNACHRPGICRQGVCTPRFQPDGTPCSDGNSTTDYDTCFQGACMGIVQPTIGPLKQQVGLQTTTVLAFPGLNATDLDALLALLRDYFSRSAPAVAPRDIKATAIEPNRARRDLVDTLILNISIATRAFSEATILKEIRAALESPQLVMLLRLRFPALARVDIIAAPKTVLECLTPVACPPITCQADEVSYASAYVSVRKCCPTCEKKSAVYSLELAAYETAVLHWREAQALQDQEYLQGPYADYLQARNDFQTVYIRWRNSSANWDQQWSAYAEDERQLYSSACSN